MKLTPKQRAALEAVAHFQSCGFSGMFSDGEHPKRVLDRLTKLGFLRDAGMGVVCDGDGFATEPERERPIWALTGAGHRLLKDSVFAPCHVCGEPAVCFGLYEQDHGEDGDLVDGAAACDDCCGHGNEDGHCAPLDEIECEECKRTGITWKRVQL